MGLAIDTVGFWRLSGGAADTAPAASTVSTGDSFQVRSFSGAAYAKLTAVMLDAAAVGDEVRILSPLLHDNSRGITFTPGELPTQFLMPREIGQPLQPSDTLTVQQLVSTATSTSVGALRIYYSNLGGVASRLHMPADVLPLVTQIKPMEVDLDTSATAGEWNDAVITTTEDLLHANADYAVLGIVTDTAVTAIALKGTDTGNLRVAVPGSVSTDEQADYFIQESLRMGTPHIPVINQANRNNTYVSLLGRQVSTAVKAQLILGLLSRPVTP